MITILFGIQVILAASLVIAVLLQRSDQDGFGLGSGSGGLGLLSGRTKANLLSRTTAIIAVLFMTNSILLTVMMSHGDSSSLLSKIQAVSNPAAQKEVPPATPTAPAVPREGEAPAAKDTMAPATEPAPAESTSAPAVDAPVESTPEPIKVPKAE